VAAIRRKLRVKHLPKVQGKRPARLQNADARNLELLSFVVERIIPFAQLLEPRFGKKDDKKERDIRLLPGHRGPKVAVPRQALKKEWNRTHPPPHGTMSSGDVWHFSSGDVLMSQYNRAVHMPKVHSEFLHLVNSEIGEAWDEEERAVEGIRQWYAGLTEKERAARLQSPIPQISQEEWDQRQEALQPLNQSLREARQKVRAHFSSEEGYQKWEAAQRAAERERFRASLTRKELIEERARRIVWRTLDKDPEEELLLWKQPLRDWFLIELRGGRGSFRGPYGLRILSREKMPSDGSKPRPSPESAPPPQVQSKTRRAGRASRTSRRPR